MFVVCAEVFEAAYPTPSMRVSNPQATVDGFVLCTIMATLLKPREDDPLLPQIIGNFNKQNLPSQRSP